MNLTPPTTRAEAARFLAPYAEGLLQLHGEIGSSSATFPNALEALRFKLLPQGPARPSALFAMLIAQVDEGDPKPLETIVGRLNVAYEELLKNREDQLWSEPLVDGGMLLHLPEMAVGFGMPPGASATEVRGARLTISSMTRLRRDDVELLGRISYQARLDGEIHPFLDRIELGALAFVRANEHTLDVYRDGRHTTSVTTFDEFAQRIARPPSPEAFFSSWQNYLGQLLPMLLKISLLLDEGLHASQSNEPGDDEEIPFPMNADLKSAVDETRLLQGARNAFRRYPLREVWEFGMVGESLAQVNNAIIGMSILSDEMVRADAAGAFTMLQSPLKPFHYLLRSLASVEDLYRWVRIDLDPEAPFSLLPINALPVRHALDRVLFEAGIRHGEEDSPHRVLVSWDEPTSRIVVTDRTEGGRSAFTAFEAEGRGRAHLEKLEPQLGGFIECLPPAEDALSAPGLQRVGRITIPVQLTATTMVGAATFRPALLAPL